jgi:hypothetical protein
MSASRSDLERDIALGLARAEAEVCAAESVLAMADSRVKALSGTLARLKTLAVQVGLIRAEQIAANDGTPCMSPVLPHLRRRPQAAVHDEDGVEVG